MSTPIHLPHVESWLFLSWETDHDMTQTMWSTKSKIFIIWPFTEKFADPSQSSSGKLPTSLNSLDRSLNAFVVCMASLSRDSILNPSLE